MTITKTALALLKKHSPLLSKNGEPNKNYIEEIALIEEVLLGSGAICGNYREGYEIYEEDTHFAAKVNGTYARHMATGMSIRYPRFIECAFTHGLNQVTILDPNRLTRSILNEK